MNKEKIEDLLGRIKNPDDSISGPAWQNAGTCGAEAVRALGPVLADPAFEIARNAKRALCQIVRHAGRPGAEAEARAVEAELVSLLKLDAPVVRREAIWMLSEIGSDRAVGPMAALLNDKDLQEDARCALTRIPGQKATAALKAAFGAAPEEFEYALADSLRRRGETIDGFPSRKLIPTRQTTVVPLAKTK